MKHANTLLILTALLLVPVAALNAAVPDFQSKNIAIGLSHTAPAFSLLAVDSLGQGKLDRNPVLAQSNAVAGLELVGQTHQFNYSLARYTRSGKTPGHAATGKQGLWFR